MNTTPAPPVDEGDRILLVDDDPTNLDVLRHTLDGQGYRLLVTRSGESAIDVARRLQPLLILLDVVMPGIDGYETCRRLKADPKTREAAVIFLSSLDEAKDKVRGLEVGAVDFVSKPFQRDEVIARVNTHLTLQRLRRQLEARNAELSRELAIAQELLTDARRRVEGPLLGDSPAIRALRESIVRHAAHAELVLLTGPQGAGHEAAARAIHHASDRGQQAFIHVNCAMLAPGQDPGFGATPPASPDSGASPPLTVLELASRGTLYLEQVDRLAPDLQDRLADVLERADASRERGEPAAPDVRFLVYTSAPLAPGAIQPRLLARLEARQLRVPSLAERPEDVADIALFFLRQHAQRIGAVVEAISDRSMKRLRKYRWPGDVRELQSLIERSVTFAREPVLEIDAALLDEGVSLGQYRLLEKLGEGGMGEVWRARHQMLARPCAIKLIRPELLGGAKREVATERFQLEARTIARLTSPNTVRLYDFGATDTGGFYFVMELLTGMDVATVVERFGPLPPERAVFQLRQACRSLAEAHGAGILHRDIKPHNLFLCRLGIEVDVLKVLDFGLVKTLDDSRAKLTAEGIVTGTPEYMPPERVVSATTVDERSDLYSLGCVAYWMLTGRPVFTGDPMAVLIHHARTAPTPPSKVASQPLPAGLDEIVLACLEKAPENRPASALQLFAQLGRVELATPWTADRAERWWREHLPELAKPTRSADATGETNLPTGV